MIVLYTGRGKGKTSACLGQAVRALGHNYPVAFCQFIKRDGTSGEQRVLKNLLGDRYYVHGCGFVAKATERGPHEEAAKDVLAWALARVSTSWVLIADEILYAHAYALLTDADLCDLLAASEAGSCHLVLSGRTAPAWLIARADYVTELHSLRHPYCAGHTALQGLEW